MLSLVALPAHAASPDAKVVDVGPEEGAAPPASAADAFAQAAHSVVTLTVPLDERHARFGKAVLVRLADGVAIVATARHVVDLGFAAAAQSSAAAARPVTARFAGGDPVPAKVEWMAPHGEDLALLSVPLADPRARPADLAANVDLRAGDKVWMLSHDAHPAGPAGELHPAGPSPAEKEGALAPAVTPGTIREVREVRQDGYAFQMLQTDLALDPGDSGSGLYDANGRLVAIQTMRALTPPGSGGAVSFALPARLLFDLAPEALLPKGSTAAR